MTIYILTTNQETQLIGVYSTEKEATTVLDMMVNELRRDGFAYERWIDRASLQDGVIRSTMKVKCYNKKTGQVIRYQLHIRKGRLEP